MNNQINAIIVEKSKKMGKPHQTSDHPDWVMAEHRLISPQCYPKVKEDGKKDQRLRSCL